MNIHYESDTAVIQVTESGHDEAEWGQRSEAKHIAVSYSIFPITPLPQDPCRMNFLTLHKLYSIRYNSLYLVNLKTRYIETVVSSDTCWFKLWVCCWSHYISKENLRGHSELFARIKVWTLEI